MIVILYVLPSSACEWVVKKVSQACCVSKDPEVLQEASGAKKSTKSCQKMKQNEEKFYKQLENDSYETRG